MLYLYRLPLHLYAFSRDHIVNRPWNVCMLWERRHVTEYTEKTVWQVILCWKALYLQNGRQSRWVGRRKRFPQHRNCLRQLTGVSMRMPKLHGCLFQIRADRKNRLIANSHIVILSDLHAINFSVTNRIGHLTGLYTVEFCQHGFLIFLRSIIRNLLPAPYFSTITNELMI